MERAATYGVSPDQLEDVYRKRTALEVNIVPEDIAEAVAFCPTHAHSRARAISLMWMVA